MKKVEVKNPPLYKPDKTAWNWPENINYKSFALLLSPLVVAILGSASRGDLFLFLVLGWTTWDKVKPHREGDDIDDTSHNATLLGDNTDEIQDITESNDVTLTGLDAFLHEYRMDYLHYNILSSIMVSFVVFFSIGGFLQWHFYIKRRDEAEEWKCQPKRFLSKKDERHEVLLGSMNLIIGASLSGTFATYAMNGGTCARFYYNVSDHGWIYLIISTIGTFVFQDAAAYYIHRALHFPFFYKMFHKMHHRYHSPTAFSAVAMHPAEFLTLQLALAIPMFVAPLYLPAYLFCIFYVYYYGMIDHSGIDLEAIWPWQPPVRFHDDHHKYFHVNFGFNTMFFDRIHDTLRKKTRIYSEKIFWGKGIEQTENGGKKSD